MAQANHAIEALKKDLETFKREADEIRAERKRLHDDKEYRNSIAKLMPTGTLRKMFVAECRAGWSQSSFGGAKLGSLLLKIEKIEKQIEDFTKSEEQREWDRKVVKMRRICAALANNKERIETVLRDNENRPMSSQDIADLTGQPHSTIRQVLSSWYWTITDYNNGWSLRPKYYAGGPFPSM